MQFFKLFKINKGIELNYTCNKGKFFIRFHCFDLSCINFPRILLHQEKKNLRYNTFQSNMYIYIYFYFIFDRSSSILLEQIRGRIKMSERKCACNEKWNEHYRYHYTLHVVNCYHSKYPADILRDTEIIDKKCFDSIHNRSMLFD